MYPLLPHYCDDLEKEMMCYARLESCYTDTNLDKFKGFLSVAFFVFAVPQSGQVQRFSFILYFFMLFFNLDKFEGFLLFCFFSLFLCSFNLDRFYGFLLFSVVFGLLFFNQFGGFCFFCIPSTTGLPLKP